MNRWDEIKGAALDAAQHVTQDPKKREAMADDLIKLVGHMMAALGKCVAVDGESDMNSSDGVDSEDFATGHAGLIVGSYIESQAEHVVSESIGAELERWEDLNDNEYGWWPKCPDCAERGPGHREDCVAGCPAHCPTEVWPCPPKPGGLSTPHTPDWVPMRRLGIGPLVTDPDGAVVQHCSVCQRLRPTTTEVTP